MKKEDFYDTKWDARDWTEEQKIKWQNKCFELGFSWQEQVEIYGLDADYYWLDSDNFLYLDSMDYEYFLTENSEEKLYEDMFPAQPEEKLDIIAEIVKLVQEAQSDEDVEDEDSFEGLVYVAPEEDCEILVSSLSSEQKEFLSGNLVWDDLDRPINCNYPVLNYSSDNKNWIMCESSDISITSFNNIFQYKEV